MTLPVRSVAGPTRRTLRAVGASAFGPYSTLTSPSAGARIQRTTEVAVTSPTAARKRSAASADVDAASSRRTPARKGLALGPPGSPPSPSRRLGPHVLDTFGLELRLRQRAVREQLDHRAELAPGHDLGLHFLDHGRMLLDRDLRARLHEHGQHIELFLAADGDLEFLANLGDAAHGILDGAREYGDSSDVEH